MQRVLPYPFKQVACGNVSRVQKRNVWTSSLVLPSLPRKLTGQFFVEVVDDHFQLVAFHERDQVFLLTCVLETRERVNSSRNCTVLLVELNHGCVNSSTLFCSYFSWSHNGEV